VLNRAHHGRPQEFPTFIRSIHRFTKPSFRTILGQLSARIHSDRHIHLIWRTVPHWGTLVMVFIETSVFTRQILDLVSDDHLKALQEWIAASPTDDLSQAQIKMLGETVKLEIRRVEDGRKTF
jgi:hypothetical protein